MMTTGCKISMGLLLKTIDNLIWLPFLQILSNSLHEVNPVWVSDLPAPCIRQWKSCLDLWWSLHGTVSRARSFFCWPHRSIAGKSESIWAFISELKAHPSSNTFSYRLVPPVLDKGDCYEGHNWSISHITGDESHDLIGALFPFCKVASIWFRFLFWHHLSWAISDKHDWQLQLVEDGGMLYYLHVERAWEVNNNGRKRDGWLWIVRRELFGWNMNRTLRPIVNFSWFNRDLSLRPRFDTSRSPRNQPMSLEGLV